MKTSETKQLTPRQIVMRLNRASDKHRYRFRDDCIQRREIGGRGWMFVAWPGNVYEATDGTLCACGQGVE